MELNSNQTTTENENKLLGLTTNKQTIEIPYQLFLTFLSISENLSYFSQGLSMNLNHIKELEENNGNLRKYYESDVLTDESGKKTLREDFWN